MILVFKKYRHCIHFSGSSPISWKLCKETVQTLKEPVSLQAKKAPEPRLRGLSRTSSFPYRHWGLQDLLRLNTERQKPGASQHTGVRQCENRYWHKIPVCPIPMALLSSPVHIPHLQPPTPPFPNN